MENKGVNSYIVERISYMGSEFKRLKRYHQIWTMIRAMAFGVAACLLLGGVLLLLGKMQILQLGVGGIALSIAVGLAVSAVSYLALRKSDLTLAEKIDQQRHLRERVQTMVAYRDDESPVAQLQRADTEQRLQQVRTVKMQLRGMMMHVVTLTAALAVFMVALMLPAKALQPAPEETQPQPTEPFYEATAWQKAALEELISHVSQSEMAESVKDAVVENLTQLRMTLETQVRVSVLQAQVVESMVQAYELTDAANSQDDMHEVLGMVSHKVGPYLSYCFGNLVIEDYDSKMDMAENLVKQNDHQDIAEIARQVLAVLQYSEFDANDDLYAAVEAFGNELTVAGEALEAKNLAGARRMTGEALYNLRNNAALALRQQLLTKEEAQYVVKTLSEIFSISSSQIPADPDRAFALEIPEEAPEVGGSQGTGEMQYPSDDKVFDYKNNLHVIYHQILDEYYKSMTNDAMDGKYSDEIEELLRKYFGNLQTNKKD